MATEKLITMTNGTNDHCDYTYASTPGGYRKAAKKLWPYAETRGVRFRVYEPRLSPATPDEIGDDLIFEGLL